MIFTSASEFLRINSPLSGEILGVDAGVKKTGIAVTVGGRMLAVSSCVLYETCAFTLAIKIKDLMKEKECSYIVLGFPFAWEEGPSALRIMEIAKELDKLNICVLLYDENRTSVKVKQTAFESKGKMTKRELQSYDSKVAALILLNALDEINSLTS